MCTIKWEYVFKIKSIVSESIKCVIKYCFSSSRWLICVCYFRFVLDNILKSQLVVVCAWIFGILFDVFATVSTVVFFTGLSLGFCFLLFETSRCSKDEEFLSLSLPSWIGMKSWYYNAPCIVTALSSLAFSNSVANAWSSLVLKKI